MDTSFVTPILEWLKILIGFLAKAIFFLAGLISKYTQIPENNLYGILLIVLSLYLSSQITEDRGIKLVGISAVIFSVTLAFGGINVV